MNEILYKQFRELPVFKSKGYIKWLKNKYPNKECHHLTGSMTGIKLHDCFIAMVTRAEHIEAEKHKIEFFNNHLTEAIRNLINYLNAETN